jgi:hypothetical protein
VVIEDWRTRRLAWGRAGWHGDRAPALYGLALVAAPPLRRRETTLRAAYDQITRLHKNLHIPHESPKFISVRGGEAIHESPTTTKNRHPVSVVFSVK